MWRTLDWSNLASGCQTSIKINGCHEASNMRRDDIIPIKPYFYAYAFKDVCGIT